jgi:hypothetical protein
VYRLYGIVVKNYFLDYFLPEFPLKFAQILINGTAKEKHWNILVIVLPFYRLVWCGRSQAL